MVVKNYGPGPLQGVFNSGIGCATGNYFMNFNIAFQQTTSPDPVVQMQGLYDQWRGQLEGRPDAVQSVCHDHAAVSGRGRRRGDDDDHTPRLARAAGDGARSRSSRLHPPRARQALLQIGPCRRRGGGVYAVSTDRGRGRRAWRVSASVSMMARGRVT
jgi:hypothetical protein